MSTWPCGRVAVWPKLLNLFISIINIPIQLLKFEFERRIELLKFKQLIMVDNLLKDHFSSLYFFAPWGTGSPAGVHLCRGPSCWV